MSIKFLGNKIFKDCAKIDVQIRAEQFSLNIPSIHGNKQSYVVEKEFEQISLIVHKQKCSRFLNIICGNSRSSIS